MGCYLGKLELKSEFDIFIGISSVLKGFHIGRRHMLLYTSFLALVLTFQIHIRIYQISHFHNTLSQINIFITYVV